MRTEEEVGCSHYHECFNGCRYGKGCYVDDLNNAMGGKPWFECRCMNDSERLELALERLAKAQKPLPADLAKAMADNAFDLYEE